MRAPNSSRPTTRCPSEDSASLPSLRDVDDAAMSAASSDPMATVTDLLLVAFVGIIDPLRAEAKQAVRVALDAGIEVRMITGDHTVTARAIAEQLELGRGLITGAELQRLPNAEVIERLPQLHVFGRVAPRTKSDTPDSCKRPARSSR
jgi:Ca2+-transporting ATPase